MCKPKKLKRHLPASALETKDRINASPSREGRIALPLNILRFPRSNPRTKRSSKPIGFAECRRGRVLPPLPLGAWGAGWQARSEDMTNQLSPAPWRRPARDAKILHERFFQLRPYLGMHELTSVWPSLFWGEERLNLPRSLDCLEGGSGLLLFERERKHSTPTTSPPDLPTPSRHPSSSEIAPWLPLRSPRDPTVSSDR